MSGKTPSYGSWAGNGQLLGVYTQSTVNRVPAAVGPGLTAGAPLQTLPRIPGGAGVGGGAYTPSPQPAALGGSTELGMATKITLVVMLIVGVAGLRYVHWRG